MKNYIVLYYSNTGNCAFLARKMAEALRCDQREVRPVVNHIFLLYLLSTLKVNIGIDMLARDVEPYDEVIIIGPIWGGQLISPLRSMIRRVKSAGKTIHFAVSCETSDAEKNDKYGYAGVLRYAKELSGGLIRNTEAFTTALVDDKPSSVKLSEKVRITNDNFKGEIKDRLDRFLSRINRSAGTFIA